MHSFDELVICNFHWGGKFLPMLYKRNQFTNFVFHIPEYILLVTSISL